MILMVSMVVTALGGIVDGIIVSKSLTSAAISALAIGSACSTLFELLAGVVATGSLSQCSKLIGRGELDKANSVFSLSCIICAILAAATMILVLFFPGFMASVFGSSPEAAEIHKEASDYLWGLGVGLPASFGTALLLPVLQLENEKRRAIIAALLAAAVNIGGDLLTVFVIHASMRWIGLFTSFSQYVALFVLLLHFRKKDCAFRFSFRNLQVKDSLTIIRYGLPTVFSRLSTMLRNIHYNTSAMRVGGQFGFSSNAIVDNVSGLLCIPPKSFGYATVTVDSVLAGEEDEKALKNMLKGTLLLALVVSSILALIFGIASRYITRIYVTPGKPEYDMVVKGIFWWSLSLIPYSINLIMISYYQSIRRMVISNTLLVIQNLAGPSLSVIVLCPLIGMDGLWISAFSGKLLTTLVLFVIMSIRCRRPAVRLQDYMYLPAAFSAETEEEINISINSMDEVLNLSQDVVAFCREHEISEDKSLFAGLCIEEMAAIIADKGFHDGKKHFIDIRIILKPEDIIVRMRDNCKRFDPRTLQNIFNPEDPFANIGIKMVANMAKEFSYINILKLNNLIINLERA